MDQSLFVVLVLVSVVLIAVGALLLRRRSGTTDAPAPSTEVPFGLASRLGRSREAWSGAIASLFGSGEPDDDAWTALEDALVTADVGPAIAASIVGRVRASSPISSSEARDSLADELVSLFEGVDRRLVLDGRPSVIIAVGVNGTGKTTTVAKLAHLLSEDGHTVTLGAADTFRAAAVSQLETWGDRIGVPVVSGAEGADPASVAFNAYRAGVEAGASCVIIDTAGRLHSRSNLMDELGKVVRVLANEAGSIDEILLVLDGTVGQNGIAQARAFTQAVPVSGVIITKLDGTSRGGIAIAVEQELGIPVKLIGVGEGIGDVVPFEPEEFVNALLAP